MSGDLTPDDMARLRVPLSVLPRLPCRGLLLYPIPGYWMEDRPRLAQTDVLLNDTGHQTVRVDGEMRRTEVWAVDLSDAATRDRCARYLAQRVEVDVGSTAPNWGPDAFHRGLWWLVGPDDGWHREVADLEAYDDRRLPDGSWWVDAAALAAVLRGAP